MSLPSDMIVEYFGKPFDHPDYDSLLQKFANENPHEIMKWFAIEKKLFESQKDLSPYPDQTLMRFCQEQLEGSIIYRGGAGPYRTWSVLRGRILRSIIEGNPSLHPAPSKILINIPRVCSDQELSIVVGEFKSFNPDVWKKWEIIEANYDKFGAISLRNVAISFQKFLRDYCWVASVGACVAAWSDARGMFFHYVPKPMN